MFLIGIIDNLMPASENPHEAHTVEDLSRCETQKNQNLMRLGIMSAISIAIHNFPEGLARIYCFNEGCKSGSSYSYCHSYTQHSGRYCSLCTQSIVQQVVEKSLYLFVFIRIIRTFRRNHWLLLLYRVFNELSFGIIFALVAGIMVYISLDELLPAAEKYGNITCLYMD